MTDTISPSWYWIKLKRHNKWLAAEKIEAQGQVTYCCDDGVFTKHSCAVGPRIPTPDESPVVPEQLTVSQCSTSQYCKGWNDCRAAMLNATPEPPHDQ